MKENSTILDKNQLFELVREQGFQVFNLLTPEALHRALDSIPAEHYQAKKLIMERMVSYFDTDVFFMTNRFCFLLCGLACSIDDEGDGAFPGDGASSDNISGKIAPFAQKNYYRESVVRLKRIIQTINKLTGFTKTQIRIFCNSGAPEKFLATASGLGWYGKNSLIINPEIGSNFIIAGIFFPFHIQDNIKVHLPEAPGERCGNCYQCVDSCPTQAIKAQGIIATSVCIQACATQLTILPEQIKKAFGNRIYGCQICQEVCPYNRDKQVHRNISANKKLRPPCNSPGPLISLKKILTLSPSELKTCLKGTVPGSSWIDMRAIQRNALFAAGNLKSYNCLNLVKTFLKASHPALADAAAWAEKMIIS